VNAYVMLYTTKDTKSTKEPGGPGVAGGNPVSGLEKPSAGFLWPDTIRVCVSVHGSEFTVHG